MRGEGSTGEAGLLIVSYSSGLGAAAKAGTKDSKRHSGMECVRNHKTKPSMPHILDK